MQTKQDKQAKGEPKNKPKGNQSKYVEAKTLAEMEFDVEEYKVAKDNNKTIGAELKHKFNKLKRGLNQIMQDKKPAKRNIGPA